MATTTFDENRTFGVEIEFTSLSRAEMLQLARSLTQAGIPTEYENYNHSTRQTWKIVYDGSVVNRNADRGWELVSPPLKGTAGLQLLRVAIGVLNQAGAKVNRSCGLHVHHDAHAWGIDEFKNIYRLYSRMELTIDEAMPQSRRGSNNQYCKSIRTRLERELDRFESCSTIDQLRGFWRMDRYLKLNMESWWRHNTIEFRQHAGTTDAAKIINWVVFTQLMVSRAESTRKLKVNFEDRRYKRNNPWRLIAVEFALHNKGSEMDDLIKKSIEFIAGRITHFRGLQVAA